MSHFKTFLLPQNGNNCRDCWLLGQVVLQQNSETLNDSGFLNFKEQPFRKILTQTLRNRIELKFAWSRILGILFAFR